MRSSSSTERIDSAMAAVQSELLPVGKNKDVEVDGAKAKWASRFSTFEALHEACKQSLIRHGVAVFQGGEFVQGGGERLVTRLSCKGEWIESSFPVKVSRDGAQGFGGGISFAKRWGLAAMVGLVSTDDAEETQGYKDNRPARASSKPKAPPALASMLEGIRAAESTGELVARTSAARAANPTGEPAAAVEQTITAWFVTVLDNAKSIEVLAEIRDAGNKIRVRGSEARDAMARAGKRLEIGAQ